MSRHILEVRSDPQDATDDPRWTIECPEGNGCNGWWECGEPHEVDGIPAGDPYDDDPDSPWADSDTYTFHGEVHEWRLGHGWTVPVKGCVVQQSPYVEPPDELYRADSAGDLQLSIGRWVVDDDWNDTDVILILLGAEGLA